MSDLDSVTTLADLVDLLNVNKDVIEKPSDTILRKINSFCAQKISFTSIINVLKLCISNNDNNSLISITNNVSILIQLSNSEESLQPLVKPFIKELISSTSIIASFNNLLNNELPQLSISIISLINSLVVFNSGVFIDDLLEQFNLEQKNVSDLLFPTKSLVKLSKTGKSTQTIRYYMIDFFINLCKFSPSSLKISLLTSNSYKKINFNLWKFINEFDNTETILKILQFYLDHVLKDVNFKKMSKCKIFSFDMIFPKLLSLYKFEESVRSCTHEFLLSLIDEDIGILFHDFRNWFNNNKLPLNLLPPNFNIAGVKIKIENSTFTVNNKIIYNLLILLNPWSDSLQLELAIKILNECSELSLPYLRYIFFINGQHLPKLSSFYVGQSLLFTKYLDLPIPSEFVRMVKQLELDTFASNETLIDCTNLLNTIIPPSITRSSLTKGLTHETVLIRHLNTQLIIQIINKFNSTIKLLKFGNNTMFKPLIDDLEKSLVASILPDPSVIAGLINDLNKAERTNKLLYLNIFKIIKLYSAFDLGVQFNRSFNELVTSKNLNKLELLLFNEYLTISNLNNSKWWLKSKTSEFSEFSNIIRLPIDFKLQDENNLPMFDNTLILKVFQISSKLLDNTIIFQDYKLKNNTILLHPCIPLVLSILDNYDSLPSILSLLDESISRCIKSPYKYIDIISKNQLNAVSCFFVTVCEQSKYAADESGVTKWLKSFTKYLTMIGEDEKSLDLIYKLYYPDNQLVAPAPLTEVQETDVLIENILYSAPNKLSNVIIKYDIELVALLIKMKSIIYSDFALEDISELLIDLMSTINEYVYQKYDSFTDDYDAISFNNLPLLNSKYWVHFFDVSNEKHLDKIVFVINLFNELFLSLKQLPVFMRYEKDLRNVVVELMKDDRKAVSNSIHNYAWILDNDQLYEFIVEKHRAEEDHEKLIKMALKRNIKLKNTDVLKYLHNESFISDSFLELISCNDFEESEVSQLIEMHDKAGVYQILNNLLLNSPSKVDLISKYYHFNKGTATAPGQFELMFSLFKINGIFESELLKLSLDGIASMDKTNFTKYLNFLNYITYSDTSVVETLLASDDIQNDASIIFSVEMSNIISRLFKDEIIFKKWINRSLLYITKVLSEHESLSAKFYEFIANLENLNINVWNYVNRQMINSQLEVVLHKWISDTNILKYGFFLISKANNKLIEYNRLINILTNNKKIGEIEDRFYLSLCLSKLYQFNLKIINDDLMIKLIKLYKGTVSASDVIIKNLLEKIEEYNKISWISYISNWDLINDVEEIDNNELVIDTPGISNSLTIVLNKFKIDKTIENFSPRNESIAFSDDIEHFRRLKNNEQVLGFEKNIYDMEFLILLIINNGELFDFSKEEEIKVNIRALIDNSLLQVIICGLSHNSSNIKEISKRIISVILLNIEKDSKLIESKKEKNKTDENDEMISSFKERFLFKVLLGNLLFTIESADKDNEEIPKLFILFLSYLVPVISNPGHFLYEKAYRYLLNGSKYKVFEIPMYRTIMNNFLRDEHGSQREDESTDHYYKELQWILSILNKCIRSNEDLKILRRNDVIEQLLNLTNSPYLNATIEDNIINVFEKIIQLENGADLLIRSFGLLSFIESKKSILEKFKRKTNKSGVNIWDKYIKLSVDSLISSDCNGKDKRSREWLNDDGTKIIKRICK